MHKWRGVAGTAAIIATAATMMGLFAVGAGSNQALSGPASAITSNSAYVPTATMPVHSQNLTSAGSPAAITHPTLAHTPNSSYRVKSGDTLAAIARAKYGKSADWPIIYWANKDIVKYANIIYVGQKLHIPAARSYRPVPQNDMAPAAPVITTVAAAVTSSHIGADTVPRTHTQSSYAVTTSFQACVIRAESGGDAQIWNASGHYGLYQFSESTWEEYGGSAASFGNASAAEQTAVFDTAMASPGGANNWAPYDGC